MQKDLLQVSLGATHIVAPHLAIAYLETGDRVRRKKGETMNRVLRTQYLYPETFKLVTGMISLLPVPQCVRVG